MAVNLATPERAHYAALDQRLLAATRAINILPTVAWPASLEQRMIAAYEKGDYALPQVQYLRPDLARARAELAAIEREAETVLAGDPIGDYLCRTASSWRIATEMLDAVGSAET